MSFNRTIIMGNLVRDPETKSFQSGQSLCKFRLACNRRVKGKDDEAMFIDVIAWGKTGELAQQFLKKGNPILIEGYLKEESWNDKDGNKRSKHVIVAEQLSFVGGKQSEDQTPYIQAPHKTQAVSFDAELLDDLPF